MTTQTGAGAAPEALRLAGILDYYGAGNIGDDLMLEGLLCALGEAERRGTVALELSLPTPWRLLSQIRRFPQVTWCRPGIGMDAELARADALIAAGDTPFSLRRPMLERALARVDAAASQPLLSVGVGAEVPAARQLPEARSLLERAVLTTVRDATSREVLQVLSSRAPGDILEGADLANITLRALFTSPGRPPAERPVPLALNWYSESTVDEDVAAVAAFVQARAPGDWPAFLSNEHRLQFEYQHFRRLFPRGTRSPVFIRPRYYAPQTSDLVTPFRDIGTLLASRYHALLIAAWAGCRVAALPRSLKVTGLVRQLGLHEVRPPITVDKLERATAEARPVSRELLEQLAHRALESTLEALVRGLPRPRRARLRPRAPPPPGASPRILVVIQDSIGDTVLNTAMLRELRASFPAAHVTLVSTVVAAPLFEQCPYIDALVPFDFAKHGHPGARAAAAGEFGRRVLAPRGFDLALLPRYDYDFWGGRAMIAACGAPRRIGYAAGLSPVGSPLREVVADPFTLTLRPDDIRHVVERSLAVVEAIGGSVRDRRLELWPPQQRLDEAAAVLAGLRGRSGGPVVAIAPGASAEHKAWPAERFAAVARNLVAARGSSIVILGGARERAPAQGLRAALGESAVDLTGQLDLNGTFAILHGCDLVLANSSAPLHLASAAGTPAVAIFSHPLDGDSNAGPSPRRFSPWMVSHRTLQPPRLEPPCVGSCYARTAHCILGITTEEATAAGLDLLEETRGRRSPGGDKRCPG